MSDQVAVDLTIEERALLARGLREWDGPTRPTDELARVMGFTDIDDLDERGEHLAAAVERGDALTRGDWARALIATEFAFASDYYGAGWDWSIVAGFGDEETIRRLREVQLKLVGIARLPPSDAVE